MNDEDEGAPEPSVSPPGAPIPVPVGSLVREEVPSEEPPQPPPSEVEAPAPAPKPVEPPSPSPPSRKRADPRLAVQIVEELEGVRTRASLGLTVLLVMVFAGFFAMLLGGGAERMVPALIGALGFFGGVFSLPLLWGWSAWRRHALPGRLAAEVGVDPQPLRDAVAAYDAAGRDLVLRERAPPPGEARRLRLQAVKAALGGRSSLGDRAASARSARQQRRSKKRKGRGQRTGRARR